MAFARLVPTVQYQKVPLNFKTVQYQKVPLNFKKVKLNYTEGILSMCCGQCSHEQLRAHRQRCREHDLRHVVH